jgi:hypothetical protein
MRTISRLRLILFCILLGLWFSGLSSPDVAAQTCNSSNSAPVNKAGWIKAAEVQVYIDPSIPGPDPVTGKIKEVPLFRHSTTGMLPVEVTETIPGYITQLLALPLLPAAMLLLSQVEQRPTETEQQQQQLWTRMAIQLVRAPHLTLGYRIQLSFLK